MDPAESHAVEKYGGGNVFRVAITDADGTPVGRAILAGEGDTIHVPWLGAEGMGGGEGRGKAQPFGTAEVMALAKQIAELDPDAKTLVFTPSAGRIRSGVERRIDLEKVREREAKKAAPPPESPAPDPVRPDRTPTPNSDEAGHDLVAASLSGRLAIIPVADVRAAYPHLSEAQLAAGLERLADQGKITLQADVDPAATSRESGVRIGKQTFSLVSRDPGSEVTAADLRDAFGDKPADAAPAPLPKPAMGDEGRRSGFGRPAAGGLSPQKKDPTKLGRAGDRVPYDPDAHAVEGGGTGGTAVVVRPGRLAPDGTVLEKPVVRRAYQQHEKEAAAEAVEKEIAAARWVRETFGVAELSGPERAVLDRLAGGKSYGAIADELGVTADRVREIEKEARGVVGEGTPPVKAAPKASGRVEDFLRPDDPESARAELDRRFAEAKLTKQERAVAEAMAGGPTRQADLAKRLGVSRQRVGQVVASIDKKLNTDLEAQLAAAGREGARVEFVERLRDRGGVAVAEVKAGFDPETGQPLPPAKKKSSAVERELKPLKDRFEELTKKYMDAAERQDDGAVARLAQEIAEVQRQGRAIEDAAKRSPGVRFFSTPLNFQFVADAARWLFDFRRAVGRVPLHLDMTNILPRLMPRDLFKAAFTTPEGLGRLPGFARLFDNRGTERTPEGQAIIARQAAKEIGKNVAALWAASSAKAKGLFPALQNGQIALAGNKMGHMADVIEAELRRPGSQPLTPEQRAWVQGTYKPLLDDFRAMLRDEGVGFFLDPQGNPVNFHEAYFPRTAIGKQNKPSPTGPGSPPRGPSTPGSKASFQHERKYATEADGAADGILYDPDPVSRVAKMIAGGYRAVADHRLANDPALQGGKTVWLDTRPANVPAPAFRGKAFPLDVARKIEAYYAAENPGLVGQAIATVNDFSKALSLGFDASVLGVQLLLSGFTLPYKYRPLGQKAWGAGAAAFFKAAFSPTAMARHLERPENAQAARELVQAGSSISRLTDFLAGMEEGSPAERLPVVGAGVRWSGRTFGAAIDAAKIELWKSLRDVVPPEERLAVAQRIDETLGSGRMEMAGLTPGRQLLERSLLLAPSLYRAGVATAMGVTQGGVSGAVARRALAGQMMATAMIAYAGAQVAGLDDEETAERFNPGSGKFLTVPVTLEDGSKVNVRFGNILTSFARLLGDLYETQTDAAQPGTGPANVALKWLRQHASPAVRATADLTTEADVMGRPQSRPETLAKAVTPIAAQDLIFDEKGIAGSRGFAQATGLRAGLGALGVQAIPVGDAEARRDAMDAESRRRFGRPYKELSLPEMGAVAAVVPAAVDKPPSTPQAVAAAIERDRATRTRMFKALSPASQMRLADLGVGEVPGYDAAVPVSVRGVGQVEVPLDKARKERYERLVVDEYEAVAGRLPVTRLKAMSVEKRKEFVQKQFEAAKSAARVKLAKAE